MSFGAAAKTDSQKVGVIQYGTAVTKPTKPKSRCKAIKTTKLKTGAAATKLTKLKSRSNEKKNQLSPKPQNHKTD